MKTRRTVKRFLFVVLAILFIMGLTACQSNAPTATVAPTAAPSAAQASSDASASASAQPTATAAEPVTITGIYWGEPTDNDTFQQAFGKTIDEFNAKNGQNITFKMEWTASSSYYDKLNALMAASAVPDVFPCHGAGKMKTYVDAGKVLQLDSYIDADSAWKSTFKPGIFYLCQFDSKTYGMPVDQMVSAIFYNKELFDKYSLTPPATWDDFLNVCKTLKSNNIIPIALGAKDSWTIGLFSEYLANRLGGSKPYDAIAGGAGDWNDPSFAKSGEMLKQLEDEGYISNTCLGDGEGNAEALVKTGKAAMICMGSWIIGSLNATDSQVVGKMDVFPFPSIPGGAGDANMWLGQTDNFCISAATKHPDASVALLKWLTGSDFQQISAEKGGKIPVTNVEIDATKAPKEFNLINAAMKNMSGMFIFYDVGLGTKIGNEYNSTMASILSGSKSPADAFSALQQYTKDNR